MLTCNKLVLPVLNLSQLVCAELVFVRNGAGKFNLPRCGSATCLARRLPISRPFNMCIKYPTKMSNTAACLRLTIPPRLAGQA
jgi:hypothetical protein